MRLREFWMLSIILAHYMTLVVQLKRNTVYLWPLELLESSVFLGFVCHISVAVHC